MGGGRSRDPDDRRGTRRPRRARVSQPPNDRADHSGTRSVRQLNHHFEECLNMLWTIAVVLLILWLLGFSVFHVAGGLIHLLLVVAVIVILYRLITGRRPV